MSESDGSTLPRTPESFSEDVMSSDAGDVFAWLRPLNESAREAFNATVNGVIRHPTKFCHMRQFLHCDSRNKRAPSLFSEDGEHVGDSDCVESAYQWNGAFKLSLRTLPRDPSKGWVLGTNRGRPSEEGIDLLLAPPTKVWATLRIAGRHARLFIHEESCRIVVDAQHTVTLGRNGATISNRSAPYSLEDGELIVIGDCAYTFQYSPTFNTPSFEQDLVRYMRDHCNPQWTIHKLLTPSSVGNPISLGNYHLSPSAFAQGTFGKVSAGWDGNGAAVAIKSFKNPKASEIKAHVELMKYIGDHPNIMRLVECVSHFDIVVPDAYCVYTPLAIANLREIIDFYIPDTAAKLALLADYLSGLAYLHDEKGVLHRDLSAGNLALTCLDNPKGIILDLDSAIKSETSRDHMQGTVTFLAPEVIKLKEWNRVGDQPPPYGKSADVWALGLNMFALYAGQNFSWAGFTPRGMYQRQTAVNERLHGEFHRKLRSCMVSAKDPVIEEFLDLIGDMTRYTMVERILTSEALAQAQKLRERQPMGKIIFKSGEKRGYEA